MASTSEDRLRAFLERNRNRITSHTADSSTGSIVDKNILASLNEDNPKVLDFENSMKKDSSQASVDNNNVQSGSEPENINATGSKKAIEGHPSSVQFSTITSEVLGQQLKLETPKKTPFMNNLKNQGSFSVAVSSSKALSTISLDSGSKPNQGKRRGMSNSLSFSSTFESSMKTKNKSRIETYLQNQKTTRDKIRQRVKSLSTDSRSGMRHLKFNFGGLNTSATLRGAVDSTSRSFIGLEQKESPSPAKTSLPLEHFQKMNLYEVLYSKEKKTAVSSKANKPRASEKAKSHKEMFFEETENSKTEKREGKLAGGGNHSRTRSKGAGVKTTTPVKTKEKSQKKEGKSKNRKVEERGRGEELNSSNASKENGKFFPESSKKLEILDNTIENGNKFKKEIKSLIGIIKKEKEQITTELNAMAKELKKYKIAYKKLKRETNPSSKNSLQISSTPLDHHRASISSMPSKLNLDEQPSRKEPVVEDKGIYPFNINELTQYIENSVPVYNEENIEDLLSKIESVHIDVESILNRNDQYEARSPQGKSNNLKSFELRKTPINCYVVKEMGLPVSLFFQDRDISSEEVSESKHNLIDLLSAQREIIYFLVKKLQIEEQQRLKTEEQASRMIAHMEKTVKQLEGKTTNFRRKEPFSPLDLNKSISTLSIQTYKCETPNEMI